MSVRFNGLTLLAYLNYTPQLRYKNEDQIHYSRTRLRSPGAVSKANSTSIACAALGCSTALLVSSTIGPVPRGALPPVACSCCAVRHVATGERRRRCQALTPQA